MTRRRCRDPPPYHQRVTAQQAGGAIVALENVTKRYGAPGTPPAVDGLSLTVPAGEICVLVGPSGCGKTTTMKMINRLIEPTSGRITIDGEDVTALPAVELRRRIGYVIQQVGLFPHQTVAENVGVVPGLLRWPAARIRERVEELLSLVGLDPAVYGPRYPSALSGGERQRVGVARALAADPPVMLMDEPFGAVDPIRRDGLQNEFLRLQARVRKTIIFVTHDVDEAIKMADRIAILKRGGILAQYDTPDAILANPASEFVERFVGADRGLKRLSLGGFATSSCFHRSWSAPVSPEPTSAAAWTVCRSTTPCSSTRTNNQSAGSTRATWPATAASTPRPRRPVRPRSNRRRPCATRCRPCSTPASSSASWSTSTTGCWD